MEEELISIYGGGIGKYSIIASAIVFLIGFFDGLINPMKCNK